MTLRSYVQQLRGAMFGGSLEIHVLAHLYQAQFQVYAYHKGEYNLVLSTEIAQRVRGSLSLTGTGKTAHYDVLEEAEALMTEPEDDPEREVEPTTLPRRKFAVRNKISLKRTTTQYQSVCGVCWEHHTRRRASVQCECGLLVYLKCIGFEK